ncbi:MAG: DNA internalization-related competence protein ComEC/Rec2 [Candidatus Electrothrix sp. AW2]|nr:DNA internalization-related competence protein ComEC/Rec2 [Candidatus Electrothrix gigas]
MRDLSQRWCDQNIFLFIPLFFALGIFTAHTYPSLFTLFSLPSSFPSFAIVFFFIGVIEVIGVTVLFYCKRRASSLAALLLILPLFFLLGNAALVQQIKKPQHAGHLASLIKVSQKITLVGVLDTMIEERVLQQSDRERDIISRFEIEAQEVLLHNLNKSGGDWQPVHGRVRLSMQGRADALQPGMTLMIPAQVGPITSFQTPGAFDYQEYLAAQNIFLTGWVLGKQVTIVRDLLREKERAGSIRFLPEQLRQQVNRFLRENLSGPVIGTYQALLVGSRAEVFPEIQEQFKATGTMHLLAISGLHIGLLVLMVGTIIRWLLKRSERLLLCTHVPTLALVATLPILLGYSFIAGMHTPVLRALIMTFALFTAFILRRQHSLFHLLAVAALLVLVCNPLTLFTASFQLSFSAVAALTLFLPTILPTPSYNEKPLSWLQNWLVCCWQRFILPAFLISFVASLGTLPFLLLHFHRFSLIGPVMNLLVEPFLCFWTLPWGLAALPCIFIAPQIATVLLNIGSWGIHASHFLIGLGAALPWASIWTITPTGAEIVSYGLLLFFWYLSTKMEKFQRATQGIVLINAVLLALHFSWGLFFTKQPVQPGESTVAYLDIGQGSSSLLRLAGGSSVLIDGGGNRRSKGNIGEQVIGPYLWQQRIWRLDQAVITHPHSDHFNGMDFILAHFHPKQLFINNDSRVEGKYQDIIAQAVQQGIEVVRPQSGYEMMEIMQQDNVGLERGNIGYAGLRILSGITEAEQGRQGRGDVNDASLVLRYWHGQRAFLFPGDIGKEKEAALLKKQDRIDMRADVLLAPHHGSSTSSSPAFLDAVDPGLIVVSAGKSAYGKRHYPAPVNVAAWTEKKIPVVVTRNQGTITCTTDGMNLRCRDFVGKVVYSSSE